MAEPSDITDDLLIQLAGSAAFGRGLAYFQDEKVRAWTKRGSAISAEVAGSEIYRVSLTHRKSHLGGVCNCPASEGVHFCKHCVAVALAYRSKAQTMGVASGGPEQRIQAYLQTLKPEQLVSQLLQVIGDDARLTRQWSLKADVALGKVDDKALKKSVTAALPYGRHLHSYDQVRAYFSKAEAAFDLLAEQIDALPAQTALGLVDYGLQRLSRALETIDDSGGFRYGVENLLHSMHKRTTARLDWPSHKLASYLYDLAFGELVDVYPSIPDGYVDILNGQVLEGYYRLLQAQWDKLPPLKMTAEWDDWYGYVRLQQPLLKRAKALNDFAHQVALLVKTATEKRDFLELCKLCMDNDAWEQAELWLARARKAAATESDARQGQGVERLQIRLHLHKGEAVRAVKLQWQVFKKSLVLGDYAYLLELSRGTDKPTDFAAEARSYLLAQLDDEPGHRASRPLINVLMAIYLQENDLTPALQLCHEYSVDEAQLLKLARRFKAQPITAMPLYHKAVAAEVGQGSNRAYSSGIALLQELSCTLKVPAHKSTFAMLIQELRKEFKTKRNFIKLLDQTFPKL